MSDHGKKSSKNRPKKRKERVPTTDTKFSFGSGVGYISTFTLFVAALVLYDVTIKSSIEIVNFEALKAELQSNVHGQDEAVVTICQSLDKIQNSDRNITVLNLVGSTGVGKTFVANIIKKYFHQNFYESWGTMKPTAKEEILNRIRTSFGYNLIVLDDLVVEDVDKVLSFIKSVPEDVVVLVICIFNIQETDDVLNYRINYDSADKIVNKFQTANIIQDVTRFNVFGPEEAGVWIVKQLDVKGVNKDFYSKIVNSLLESHNVKYHGLKGLGAKILLKL